jgi:muramoyltetrapeptide carboxypeptidase
MALKQRPRIHITAVASAAHRDVDRLGPGGLDGMIALAQEGAGENFRVTASREMIYSRHHKTTSGRSDDEARIREIEGLLADEDVAAVVTLRGGAWFTRLLNHINFDLLKRRKRSLYLFGFSEMTTLIAITSQYPKAVGLYDMGPGFLFSGMERYARKHIHELVRSIDLSERQHEGFAAGWASARYSEEFKGFFKDVANIVEGKGSQRVPSGRLLTGSLPRSSEITMVGGTLSVLLPLIGSKYLPAVDTAGKWLALEDINEAADPIDRMLAGFQLSGMFQRVEGIILGDFHDGEKELSDVAFQLLKYHLPPKRRIPVIRLDNFGHIYPMAPLPMNREVVLTCNPRTKAVELNISWSEWGR